MQDARKTIELTRYTIAKLEEHQMAKMGGFPRSRRWRCSEGMTLKNEHPGMRRVWMILGLLKNLFAHESQMGVGLGDVHCHMVSNRHYPNRTKTDLSYAEEHKYNDHHGCMAGDRGSSCPTWITSPGEVMI